MMFQNIGLSGLVMVVAVIGIPAWLVIRALWRVGSKK